MEDHQSPYSQMDEERSSSPKRRKIRQKYAPKACVSCRRSKLKCTGENPCQRCVQNGKRCFYSEDQTAAEVLQNLSRPTPTPSQPSFDNSNGNGNGSSRRGSVRHDFNHEALHARGNENNNMATTGMSMEDRMTRVEAMLEALMQDRGLAFTPSGSIEREDTRHDGIKMENAFPMPILDPIHPDLQRLGQPSPEQMHVTPHMGSEPMPSVRVGDRELPFPDPARYQQYVCHFFGDVHLRYPCVDEVDFNARVQRLMTRRIAEHNDVHFLALCYLLFACCDVLLEPVVNENEGPRNADWFQLADSIIDKRSLLLNAGMDLVQCFLFQAIYLMYADIPAAAYSAIRTTCNLIFQLNIHKQESWGIRDPEREYWQLCVFWTVYLVDQHISLSCGRPASLSDHCEGVETPEAFCSRVTIPSHTPSDVTRRAFGNEYLSYMIKEGRITTENARSTSNLEPFRLGHDIAIEVPDFQFPNFPPQSDLNPVLKRLTELRPTLTKLLLGIRSIATLAHNDRHAKYFNNLAIRTLEIVREVMDHTEITTAPSHLHHLASAVAGTLLVHAALLLLPPESSHMQISEHADRFEESAGNLARLPHALPYATRVQVDCQPVIDMAMAVVARWRSLSDAQRAAGWSAVAETIPPDAAKAFPYQETSPALQVARGMGEDLFAGAARSGSGVLWMF